MSKEFTTQDIFLLLSQKLESFLNKPDEKTPKQGFYKTAEEIFRKHGIKVYMYNERNSQHKLPHIHIKNGSGQEVVVRLNTEASILAGKCDSKTLKKIKSFVCQNIEILIKIWNAIYYGEEIKSLKEQIQYIK